ncbi:MAG: hypothetical protein JXA21_16005 [Anaerolineae bacterium]|nr:hypothetical protein [Anaerolineae bacterium]
MSETKSPAEIRAERMASMRSEWNNLSTRATLGQAQDAIEDVGGRIEGIPHRIEAIRKRGYIYGRGWKAQADALRRNWPARRLEARRILDERKAELRELSKEIDNSLRPTNLPDSVIDRLESMIDGAESRISSAESNVRGAYDSLENQLGALENELRQVESSLEALDAASFQLFPEEHLVTASEAVWTDGKDEPKGYLFLTDGRVVFEQREKKATKKVLFITTKSELLQEKLWEAAIGVIEDVELEDKRGGLLGLGSKEMLTLRFRERTRELPSDVTVQVKGTTNEAWQSLIKRVQSGDIDSEREGAGGAAAGSPATPAAPPTPATPSAEIPTKCPTCGGQLPTVYKGMRELTCEYCGSKVRF